MESCESPLIIMLGIIWRHRKRTSWFRKQTKDEDILTTIKRKKWPWEGTSYTEQIIDGLPGMEKEGRVDRELDGEMR